MDTTTMHKAHEGLPVCGADSYDATRSWTPVTCPACLTHRPAGDAR